MPVRALLPARTDMRSTNPPSSAYICRRHAAADRIELIKVKAELHRLSNVAKMAELRSNRRSHAYLPEMPPVSDRMAQCGSRIIDASDDGVCAHHPGFSRPADVNIPRTTHTGSYALPSSSPFFLHEIGYDRSTHRMDPYAGTREQHLSSVITYGEVNAFSRSVLCSS